MQVKIHAVTLQLHFDNQLRARRKFPFLLARDVRYDARWFVRNIVTREHREMPCARVSMESSPGNKLR